jgi:hypothetical protein
MQTREDECERINTDQVWLNVSQDSSLHLDRRLHNISTWDLDYFPFPFNAWLDLSDVLFVVPPSAGLAEQESLLRLAATLGEYSNGTGFKPAVSLGGEGLDADALNRYHIIAIGRPSTNPFIRQINSLLPQPLVADSDEIEYRVGEVLLRLPPGTHLGCIQEIPSPWNERQALIVVTGTADEGVTWATHVMEREPWRLKGNLVLVREGGKDIQTIDTRGLTSSGLSTAIATAVPELAPVVTVTPTVEAGTDNDDVPTPSATIPSETGGGGGLPTWVQLVVGITVVIVLTIFSIAIWRSRRR